jgi:hypothetical protein
MNEPACDTATLLPNGKVLITGSIVAVVLEVGKIGDFSQTFVRHAELYDPSTGTFSFTGDMIASHTGPTATLLLNGKVLVAGGDIGDGDGASASAELYDPASESFALTGKITTGREENTATLLPDGRVLLAGGHTARDASAELYDPVTGTFSATGDMIAGRASQTATLLNSGKVLIAGGRGSNLLTSAEIYNSPVLVPAPMLLSLSGDGRGQGAIWHADTGQIASSQSPAASGEILSMYTTSLGDGSVIPPQVAIGGRLGEILYFGDAPGYSGFNQVNVRVPSGVAPGSAVPVRLTYIARPSNQVTIGVQ